MVMYVCRYDDADVEYCSFHPSRVKALKSRASFRRRCKKFDSGSIEKIDIERSQLGFLEMFDKYALKYVERS